MSDEYYGLYKGLVVDNDDKEKRGRVILRIPQVLGDTVSNWCEPTVPSPYRPKIGDIVYVQFINGDLAKPVYVATDMVTADKFMADIVLAMNFFAGDPLGAHMRLGPDGLHSTNGAKPTGAFRSDGSMYLAGAVESLDYVEGEQGWRLDSDQVQIPNLNVLGEAGAARVSANEIVLGGVDLAQELDSRPAGLIAYGKLPVGSNSRAITDETIVARFNIGQVRANRYYKITYHTALTSAGLATPATALARMRVSTAGDSPSLSHVVWDGSTKRVGIADTTAGPTIEHTFFWSTTSDYDNVRGALTLNCVGPGSIQMLNTDANYGTWVAVEDIGLTTEVGGSISQYAKDQGGTPGSQSDDPEPKATYTWSFVPQWGQSYSGSNGQRVGGGSSLYHGYYSSVHGNQKSMVGDFTRNGTLLHNALRSSDTIKDVKLTFRVQHAGAGTGLDLNIGTHGNANKPGTWGNVNTNRASRNGSKAGSTYTVSLSNAIGNELKNGSARGIVFGPGSGTGISEYGYLYGLGSGDAPSIKVTFER